MHVYSVYGLHEACTYILLVVVNEVIMTTTRPSCALLCAGAGKTTLVKHILSNTVGTHRSGVRLYCYNILCYAALYPPTLYYTPLLFPGMKVLVIENEVGEEGIDHDLLLNYAGKEEIILLKNGCVCCTVRSDLIQTFRAIFAKNCKSTVT
jgi:hypothetical protein